MIRKILITLTVVIGTIGVGWGAETTKLTKADNICFANGNPITITESTTAGSVTITVTGTQETVTIASTGTVYGGSKNAEAASSTITMESGTIANIYGGGLGEVNGTPANIKGNTSITIKGGTVSHLLVGGGHFYSKSNDVTINISGSTTKLASVISGGYDAGKTTNSLATTLGNSVNGVKSVALNMIGGEITVGLGCGGGNGFSYTGKSVITLNGVKLAAFYGVLSNGRADDIKATVTNCTFAKNGNWYEFASLNRGTAANIDFTFDGCTFNNLDQINASLGPVNGWADSDTDGKVIPCVTGKTKFVFTNTKGEAPVMQVGQGLESADIELTGAKAKIDKFVKKNPDEIITAFTIGAGKTWTFNNGLEMAKGVTLTQTGTLVVKGEYSVANAEQLVAAVAAAPADAIIQLAAGTYTLDKQLIVDKPIVLIGAGKDQTTIKGQICITATNSAAVKFDKLAIEGTANIIEIGTEKTGKETPIVTLTNCKVTSTKASGIRLLSVGAQLELKNTDIDAYYYGIGVRNEKQKITVDGGIITGWAALMTSAGGLETNDGTLANTGTVIDIKNGATLRGRSISDEGYGVITLQQKFNGVTLHIDGSTVIATKEIIETSDKKLTTAIKQLRALDIRSYGNRVTVTNSTLSALYSENALNAAIVSLGWHSADFGVGTIGKLTPDDLSTPAQNTITINGTLTNKAGEKYVTTYRKANNQKFDGLTINGTSYSVEAGNVCRTYQRITGGVTVDDNGNPIATNNEALLKAITDAKDGGTVSLGSDITLANSDKQYGLAINKKITLDGNGHTITAAEDFVGYMITVGKEGSAPDGIQIKNLTLNNNKKAKGLNIYASKNVVLTNVTSKDGLGAGVVVNSSTVTATNLTTSGNGWGGVNVDKGTPVLTLVSGSFGEDPAIYSDMDGAATEEAVSKYVVFTNGGWEGKKETSTSKYIWKKKTLDPEISGDAKPTAFPVEAGQPLSSSVLKGGTAKYNGTTISGVFNWEDPNIRTLKGTNNYTVVFTPNDLVTYSIVKTDVPVVATSYYNVMAGACTNGKLIIKNANVANKYKEGQGLTIEYLPDANYKLVGTPAASYTVSKNDTIEATFAQIEHQVNITAGENGSLKVMDGATAVNSGASVAQGTVLSIIATPAESYQLDALTSNAGVPVSNGSVTVSKALNIAASFKAIPASYYTVQVNSGITNGKLLLTDAAGNAVNPGSSVVANTALSVVAIPDNGYKLSSTGITATGSSISNNACTVTAHTTFSAGFEKETYAVTKSETNGSIEITGSSSLTAVEYGTVLTVTATANADYRLNALVVNGKEIPNGGTFVVTEATEVIANVSELATITLIDKEQSFTYDGMDKEFSVKTIPAGLTGFTVSYSGGALPVNAEGHTKKEYTVTITRPADKMYKAVNVTDAKLIIEAAEMKGLTVPTWANTKSSTGGTWTGNDGKGTYAEGTEASGIFPVTFTPTDANYKAVVFSTYKTTEGLTQVTLENSGLKMMKAAKDETASLSVSGTHGSVTLWNGAEEITSASTIYVGQKLTAKGMPNQGYSTAATWTLNGASATAEITLATGVNNITAVFAPKATPTAVAYTAPTSLVYTGSSILPTLTNADGWTVTIESNGMAIDNPTEVGTYTVYATRSEDALYAFAPKAVIGTYAITPKELTGSEIAVTSATPILKGVVLAQSTLAGKAPVDGQFTWEMPNKVAVGAGDGSSATVSNAYPVVFTPNNKNYLVKSDVKLTQTVPFYAATKATVRTITFAAVANGTFKVFVNGTEVNSGATISTGDKVKVSATPKASYTASVVMKENSQSVSYALGADYTVLAAGNIEVTVSFTYTGGGGSVTPSPIAVSSVSLDQATLALPRLNTATLVATINPTDAANKSVTWTSSDEKVATVDANGKVTAVKVGKATITVTTEDGGKTATCEVTVSVATGVEEILANTRVYAQQGAICIDPALPVKVAVVNMLGAAIYNGQIAGSYRIATVSGVYVVKLSDGKNEAFVKVYVR